ncbi:hypothetical protein WICPIJ_006798 [Wickerhamomyces pijperi]|uniref:Zn(2)-C6 fungal-type domain-containing protein n=1 Tax=Wickerhamomyces pijperi TaxID=599730 RepID=A0A9P8Q2V5_WICPI|nr:hypothetical protein WICPIJ_006798 [Wickerhamomyces pijperi]
MSVQSTPLQTTSSTASTVSVATPNSTVSNTTTNNKKSQKSRNGCSTCKRKRLKCDETKPACQNCIKRGIECGGYSTNFKWKSFEEIMNKTPGESNMSSSSTSKSKDSNNSKSSGASKAAVSNPMAISTIATTDITNSVNKFSSDPNYKHQQSTQQQTEVHSIPMQKKQRSYSTSSANKPNMDDMFQKAAYSISGRSTTELAQESELIKMGKNPNSKRKVEEIEDEKATNISEMKKMKSIEETPSNLLIQNESNNKRSQQHQLPPISSIPNSPNPFSPSFPNLKSHSPGASQQQQQPPVQPLVLSAPSPHANVGGLKNNNNNSANSPTFSSIVRAFTDFDNINIPSPLTIDPLSPTPSFNNQIAHLINQEPPLGNGQPRHSSVAQYGNGSHQDYQGSSSGNNSQPLQRSQSMDSSTSSYRQELLNFSKSLQTHSLNQVSKLPPLIPPMTLQKFNLTASEFEKVFNAFDKYTCEIMSIKNGPTSNPWRSLIWPLGLKHSVLFKSLASMSLFHVARGDSSMKKLGVNLMKQSMNELAEGLMDNSIPNEVALATCLTLAVTETWDKPTSSGLAHLKGAKSIINKLDYKSLNINVTNYKLYRFLINCFVYYDVMARMSSVTVNLVDSDYEESGALFQNLKNFKVIDDELKAYEMNESGRHGSSSAQGPPGSERSRSASFSNFQSVNGNDAANFDDLFPNVFGANELNPTLLNEDDGSIIDPLLGCARGLFLIIGRVATFISKTRSMTKLSLNTISTAVTLRQELENWKPDSKIKPTYFENDPNCDLSSCIATAESYRYATLLYLQQAVPEISATNSLDLADKVLMLLASIPTSSSTSILHIFPLLISSCEIQDSGDREWILQRWKLLSEKMWIGTIDRATDVVKEVWRRKDISSGKTHQQQQQKQNSDKTESGPGSRKLESVRDDRSDSSTGSGKMDGDWDYFQNRIDSLTKHKNREQQGINSWTHWSTVMKEWNWEILLG